MISSSGPRYNDWAVPEGPGAGAQAAGPTDALHPRGLGPLPWVPDTTQNRLAGGPSKRREQHFRGQSWPREPSVTKYIFIQKCSPGTPLSGHGKRGARGVSEAWEAEPAGSACERSVTCSKQGETRRVRGPEAQAGRVSRGAQKRSGRLVRESVGNYRSAAALRSTE